jgi:hypothetical protein
MGTRRARHAEGLVARLPGRHLWGYMEPGKRQT